MIGVSEIFAMSGMYEFFYVEVCCIHSYPRYDQSTMCAATVIIGC